MSALAVIKTGRCANGAHRAAGLIVHALAAGDAKHIGHGGSWSPALCGTVPGRLSAGWAIPHGAPVVNCPRCVRKLQPKAPAPAPVKATWKVRPFFGHFRVCRRTREPVRGWKDECYSFPNGTPVNFPERAQAQRVADQLNALPS